MFQNALRTGENLVRPVSVSSGSASISTKCLIDDVVAARFISGMIRKNSASAKTYRDTRRFYGTRYRPSENLWLPAFPTTMIACEVPDTPSHPRQLPPRFHGLSRDHISLFFDANRTQPANDSPSHAAWVYNLIGGSWHPRNRPRRCNLFRVRVFRVSAGQVFPCPFSTRPRSAKSGMVQQVPIREWPSGRAAISGAFIN